MEFRTSVNFVKSQGYLFNTTLIWAANGADFSTLLYRSQASVLGFERSEKMKALGSRFTAIMFYDHSHVFQDGLPIACQPLGQSDVRLLYQ